METIAAVVRVPKASFELARVDVEEPRPDEILIRMEAVGICHTDIIARDQIIPVRLPVVLGHEGVGIVHATGSDVANLAPGDRVVLSFRSCGACARCDASEPAYCAKGPALNYAARRSDGSRAFRDADGAIGSHFFGQSSFSAYALAHYSNAVKVETTLPPAVLAPLGCGVQTGAGAVLRSLACPPGSTLLVAGAGTVGLSAVLAAVIAGCSRIVVFEANAERRALARELGATDTLSSHDGPLPIAVTNLVPGGVDFAIDTTGAPTVLDGLLLSLRSHGTLAVVGAPRTADALIPGRLGDLLTFGWTIRGVIEGDSEPQRFIPELIALHEQGRFPFDRLISTYAFEDINQAVADQHAGKAIKPVLIFPTPDQQS